MATTTNPLLLGTRGKVAGLVVYQDGGQTIIREHVARNTSETSEQVRARALHKELSRQWQDAGGFAQAKWAALCARVPRWNPDDGAGMGPFPSGYHLFQSVGTARAALSLPMYAEPLATPRFPGLLPPLTLASPGPSFSLHVGMTDTAHGVFPDGCQIFATRGRMSLEGASTRFALLTTVPALGPEGLDLSDVYAARVGAARAGWTVRVRVVPVSADGFRGPSVSLSCVAGV